MTTCPVYSLSNGTKIYFAPLAVGSCAEPEKFTFVVKTAAIKGATSLEITATTTTASKAISIPANTYITVTTAAGLAVPVLVTAAASGTTDSSAPFTADLTLTVSALYAALAVGASGQFPEVLTGRSKASIARTGVTEEIVNFESVYYTAKVGTSGSWAVSADGQFQITAPYLNAQYVKENAGKGFLEIVLPSTNAELYSVGAIYKGEVVVGDMPIDLEPKKPIIGNIAFEGAGDLVFIPPVAA
jgi:hypothetical protein